MDHREQKEVDRRLEPLPPPPLSQLLDMLKASPERCLVYALMVNGSLEQNLAATGYNGRAPLPWALRLRVAVGAARGLDFLHSQPRLMCVHRDIKSANILLDEKMNARIGDFGIMRQWGRVSSGRTATSLANTPSPGSFAATHLTTQHLQGTWGYICPQYARTGQLSPKCDVFSFGVVLLEILTGRSAINPRRQPRDLVSQVEDSLYEVPAVRQVMDPLIRTSWPISSAMKFASVASRCVEPRARRRPSVSKMRDELEAIRTDSRGLQQAGTAGLAANPEAEKRAERWDEMVSETGSAIGLSRDCGFECPITSELMLQPVIADDGHSYECAAIESWFSAGNRTSPVTGQVLQSLVLRPNHALRAAISQRFDELRRLSITRREAAAEMAAAVADHVMAAATTPRQDEAKSDPGDEEPKPFTGAIVVVEEADDDVKKTAQTFVAAQLEEALVASA